MTSIHEDDSIFDLIVDDSDLQQPIVVEECAETLIDSDDFPDTLLQSDHESDQEDSPAIGGLNGHRFPRAEPQPDLTAASLCELWAQPTMCEEELLPEESPFDSQCTANDNPGLRDRALPVPLTLGPLVLASSVRSLSWDGATITIDGGTVKCSS